MARPHTEFEVVSLALLSLFTLGACRHESSAQSLLEEIPQADFRCDADGWCWEHPVPHGYALDGVWGSADGSLVIAVGEHGTIVERVNGVWRQVNVGTALDFLAVHGWPSGDAVAVGEGGLVVHRESGAWRTRTSGSSETLFHVWGPNPRDVMATGGLHWNGTRWRKIFRPPRKWKLHATEAAIGSYSYPPGAFREPSLEELERGLADGSYQVRVLAACPGPDGAFSFLGDMWGTMGPGTRAGGMTSWHWLVRAEGTEWDAWLTPDLYVPEYGSKRPLLCSQRGKAPLVVDDRKRVFYRTNGDRFERVDRVDDVSGSQIATAAIADRGCSSSKDDDFVKKWPRSRGSVRLLCAAPREFGDSAWVNEKGTDGVVVGNDGRVSEYRGGSWTQVFPEPTQYSRLLRTPSAYDYLAIDKSYLETDELRVDRVRWKYSPALWASQDGEAYVAHGRTVLKRTAPGQWAKIYKDGSGHGLLTAMWGTSANDLFVGSSAGYVSRYDGKRWTKEYADGDVSITAIWGTGDDVWATGADRSSSMLVRAGACSQGNARFCDEPDGIEVSVHRGLLLHRIRNSWRKVTLPKDLPTLSSMWAGGTNDVYVGTLGRGLWHFNGKAWKHRKVRRPRTDSAPDTSLDSLKLRDLDFIAAIWGTPAGRIFVAAAGNELWNGIDLFVLDGASSRTVGDIRISSSMHGTVDHILGSLRFRGVAQLRDNEWIAFDLRGGEVSRVWAGEDYDYALSREGYFWSRKHKARRE